MKRLFFVLLFIASITMAQVYHPQSHYETRTCIVCGQEWKEWQEETIHFGGSNFYVAGGGVSLFNLGNEPTGLKWSVILNDQPYLCEHCNNIYAEKWRNILEEQFNALLVKAIDEQKDYSLKVKLELKNRKLDALKKKLDELQKQFSDESKR